MRWIFSGSIIVARLFIAGVDLAFKCSLPFAETSPAGGLPTGRAAMINEKGGKLIVYEAVPPGLTRPEMELFRGNDPAGWEKRSLVASAPAVAAHKREVLTGWRETKGKLQLAPDPKPATPSPRLAETLRALGYLQGMEPVKASSPVPRPAGESPRAGKP